MRTTKSLWPPGLVDVSSSPAWAGQRARRFLVALVAFSAFAAVGDVRAEEDTGASPRRLTQLEYAHSLQDLLMLEEEAALALGRELPPEADSGGFDTLAKSQGISGLHVRTYLRVADRALDEALLLGPAPDTAPVIIEYARAPGIYFIATGETFGLGIVALLDDAVLMVDGVSCTYSFDSSLNFYNVPRPGLYRVTLEGYRYQADSPVVITLFRGRKQGVVASLDELIGAWDVVDDTPRVVEVETFLRPGDLIAPCAAEMNTRGANPLAFLEANTFLKDSGYPGEGMAYKSLTIDGPLYETWPPRSTRAILVGVDFDEVGNIQLSRSPGEHLTEIVANFAERAFRRPVEEFEVAALVALGEAVLDQGRPFIEAVRTPLAAILSSPQFLYQPQALQAGRLDDYEFATRLAYFLWRSFPDAELLELARQGALSDDSIVRGQVDRMLDDPRSWRFIEDFSSQAYRLDEIRATTPAAEFDYDERLGQAMTLETKLFLAELIRDDLSVGRLIDADFTYLNRRLAALYGIPGVAGQEMRRVPLSPDSLRGGLLTQASVLKISANGTTTSPVPRGNFVLGPLLGMETPPPPAGVNGLEPDTRGTTTVREQLAAHASEPVCYSCHRLIDPPGFALEQFDPIGGFRTEYRPGVPVDATGVTPSGQTFDGIIDYKAILLDEDLEQVARNLVSQLLVFGTGEEIESDDADEVERILDRIRGSNYGFRSALRAVAVSDLFGRR